MSGVTGVGGVGRLGEDGMGDGGISDGVSIFRIGVDVAVGVSRRFGVSGGGMPLFFLFFVFLPTTWV